MVKMLRKLLIPVPSGGDMEIPLHLIPLQTPINATGVNRIAPSNTRPLRKLLPGIAAHLTHDMTHMCILLLSREPRILLVAQRLVLMAAGVRLVVALLHPLHPACILAAEQDVGEDAVARSVLDVHAQRVAGHVDHDVEVQLQVVRDAFFNAEMVVFGAAPPGPEFREAEDCAYGEDEDGPLSAAVAGCGVGGFCLGWMVGESIVSGERYGIVVFFSRVGDGP